MHPREARRRDTNDREVESREANLPAHDPGIRSKLIGPCLVCQHNDRISSRYLIFILLV